MDESYVAPGGFSSGQELVCQIMVFHIAGCLTSAACLPVLLQGGEAIMAIGIDQEPQGNTLKEIGKVNGIVEAVVFKETQA